MEIGKPKSTDKSKKKKKFLVTKYEVWTQPVVVEVEVTDDEENNENYALELVSHGEGDYVDGPEFSHDLESDEWAVEPWPDDDED